MEAYPLLVRKRIIELYEQDKPTKEIAELFGICRSGTRRVKQHLRERGTIAPRPRTNAGRKPKLTPELRAKIRDHVAARPDCTRAELKATLGLTVSLQAIRSHSSGSPAWISRRLHASPPGCRRSRSTVAMALRSTQAVITASKIDRSNGGSSTPTSVKMADTSSAGVTSKAMLSACQRSLHSLAPVDRYTLLLR